MATTTAKALPDEALTEQALQRLLTAYEGRQQMFDPQMLAMAAGFLAPTQTGGFGESLSNAAKGVLQAGEAEQKQEQERAKGLLEVAQVKGQIAQRKRIQDQYADVLSQKFATPGAGEAKTSQATDDFTLGGLTKTEYLLDAAANGVSRAEAEEKWAKLKRENVTPKEGYVYNHQTGKYEAIDLGVEQVKLDLLARDADGGIQSVFVSKPEARNYQVAVAQARKSGKKEDWQKVFAFEQGFTQGIPSFDEKPAPPKEAAAKEEGAPLVVPLPQVGAAQEPPVRPQFAPAAQVPPQAAPQIPPQAAPQAAPQVPPQAAPQGAASLATSPRVDAALGRPEAAPPPVAPAAPARAPGALPFAIPTGGVGGAPAVATGKPTGTPTAQQLAAQKAAAETQAAITKAGGEAQARANVEAAMGPPTAGNTSYAQTTGSNLAKTETGGAAVKAEKEAEAQVAAEQGALAAGRISQAQAEGKSAGELTQLIQDRKKAAILARQQGKDLERIVKETPEIFGQFDKPGVMNAALKLASSPLTVGNTSASIPLLYDAYLRAAGFSQKAIDNYTTSKQYFSAIELAKARENKGQGTFTDMERLVLRNVAGQPTDSKELVLKAAKFLQMSSDFDIKFANEYDKWIERFPRSNVIEFQRSKDYKEMELKYDKQLENTFFPSAKPTNSAPRPPTGRSANVQRAFDLIGGPK